MGSIRLVPLQVDGPLFDRVVSVFVSAFPAPASPEERTAQVAAMTRKHAGYPGFRGVVALSDQDQVAGLAYGYVSTPGQFYRSKLEAALGPGWSDLWLSDCFEFVELAAAPEFRRMGIGGARLTRRGGRG